MLASFRERSNELRADVSCDASDEDQHFQSLNLRVKAVDGLFLFSDPLLGFQSSFDWDEPEDLVSIPFKFDLRSCLYRTNA